MRVCIDAFCGHNKLIPNTIKNFPVSTSPQTSSSTFSSVAAGVPSNQLAAANSIDMERGGGPRNGKWRGGGASGASGATAASPFYYEPNSRAERKCKPWIVPVFVAANVAMFVVAMYVNNCPAHSNPYQRCVAKFLHRFSFQPLHQNPLFGPSSSTLEKLGGLVWDKIVHQNQGWRLITCIWLHAGVIHLLANILSLLFVGIRLEQQFGFVRIGILYLLSGFGGSVLSSLFIRNSISVGASGALFGLLGAMLSELITNWSIYTNKAAALFILFIIIAINLAVGILPHVDNFAHIGGFITGFLLGFVLLFLPQFGKHKAYQYVLCVLALLLLASGFAVGLVMLFRGVNGSDHCKWCHYLNCVPSSRWSCGN